MLDAKNSKTTLEGVLIGVFNDVQECRGHNECRCQARSIHSTTHEHLGLQLHQHLDTQIDHSCSLHKATNHILLDGSKKGPKVRKHGAAALG